MSVVAPSMRALRAQTLRNKRRSCRSDEEIRAALHRGYRASAKAAVLAEADAIVICVPTPLSADRSPDTTAVQHAIDDVARFPAVSQADAVLLIQADRDYGADDLVARPQSFFDLRGASGRPGAIRLGGRV